MPGIEIEGFRIIVNTRDERGHKPHVHVRKGGGSVLIRLDDLLTSYRAAKMSRRDIARARDIVREHFDKLMEWWNQYNG